MAFRVRHPPHSAWKRITKARTSDAGEDALRRLRSFLDAKEPEIVRLLARLWGDQQQAITYQELRTAILNGYIDEQTAQDWMNDYSHFVNEKLRPQWEDAMRAANARLEAEHPGLFFNAHDPGVQEWLSTRGGELITVIGWEQRQAVNAMVSRAYAGEWTVDELARAIRPTIGLNRPQAAANLNYYERTKATLLQNNPSMREATAEKRAREAAVKYAEKQHRYRAFMIARTEMAFAYNRGMDEGIKQAIAKGYMGACVRVWVTAADERMCPVCGELEGVEIGMEGQYDFSRVNSRLPSGPTPPAHPNCRCAVDYREIAPPAYQENSVAEMRNYELTVPDADGIIPEGEGIMQTGGRETGGKHYAPPSEGATERDIKAAEEYRKISRVNDTEIIAQNTGFSVEDIVTIKRHIFFEKHKTYDGYELLQPDYDMAVAWNRLKAGRPEERDILLLHHELLESQIETERNCTLAEAHAEAQSVYNWSAEMDRIFGEDGGEPDGLL